MPPVEPLRLALPKGRMQDKVHALLADAGLAVRAGARGYRPQIGLPGADVKILKPQNVVEMLQAGSRDVGFAGADWVRELGADLVEVLDTGLDPVRMVAAAPPGVLEDGGPPRRPIVVASEYERISRAWIAERRLDATFVRSYGATEVFPPEDADCIVDIVQTGDTLRANNLVIFDELGVSSTRMYASTFAYRCDRTRPSIERLAMLFRSVLEARARVMIEVNVAREDLERLVSILPCMREPTVAALHGGAGYAVKSAVPRDRLAVLIPEIKACGGTDLVVFAPAQIIP